VLRRRTDSFVAVERLATVVSAPLRGGWLPPPLPEPPDATGDEVDRSWADGPAEAYEQAIEPNVEPAGAWFAGLVPEGLRGGRWDPGRRGVAALAAVAVLAALVTGAVLLRGRPHEVPATLPSAAASPAGPGGPVVVVDVAGKVHRPGIVRLPFGSRVYDALRAAGGALTGASTDGLNLARKLTDGEQVLVGVAAASGPAGSAGGLLDLNAADVTALDGLPGIGPVLAQKIVDWRTEHGRFASVDQLREVGGIGESKFAALRNKVRV
jgi:competence protein ComEA